MHKQALQTTYLTELEERLAPLRQQLASHPLYGSIGDVADLHGFMEAHVFAVWDFMSLLKALQRGLTCIDVPWLPSAYPEARRLVNEIVLGEESDLYPDPEHGVRTISHFELYLESMRASGADARGIEAFLKQLQMGASVEEALQSAPAAAQAFVAATFGIIDKVPLHAIAAAFTFGREDLIPDMFRGFVRELDRQFPGRLQLFSWYLERHIEVDGEEHGPMALRMVLALCGENRAKWQQATEASEAALRARLALWDGILAKIVESRSVGAVRK